MLTGDAKQNEAPPQRTTHRPATHTQRRWPKHANKIICSKRTISPSPAAIHRYGRPVTVLEPIPQLGMVFTEIGQLTATPVSPSSPITARCRSKPELQSVEPQHVTRNYNSRRNRPPMRIPTANRTCKYPAARYLPFS